MHLFPPLGFQTQTFHLTYELPSTLQVSFSRAIGNQMALVRYASLNEKQRFLLQTAVRACHGRIPLTFFCIQMQSKIHGNGKTNGLKITLTNSSTVDGEHHYSISLLEHVQKSRQVLSSSNMNG